MPMAAENNLSLWDTRNIGLLMFKSVLQLFSINNYLQENSSQYSTLLNVRNISNSQPVVLYIETVI